MIRRALARYAYPTAVLGLVAGILVVGGFLAVVAMPDLVGTAAVQTASPAPAGSPSPTPKSAMALSAAGIEMPPDANCNACHLTTSGTVGLKPIPKLGHQVAGFGDCTACHNPTGLVKTAPGHSSLHKADCLICHQENPDLGRASAAPLRPAHMGGTTAPCTSCHGVDKHAPLPDAMKGRDNCWICHNGPEYQYLFSSASPGATGSPAASAGPPGASYPLYPGASSSATP